MEKHLAAQSQIHSVIINQYEITDQAEIITQMFSFYQSLFLCKAQIQTDDILAYLENITSPKLTNEQTLSCKGIKSMENNLEMMESLKNSMNVSGMKSKNLFLALFIKHF